MSYRTSGTLFLLSGTLLLAAGVYGDLTYLIFAAAAMFFIAAYLLSYKRKGKKGTIKKEKISNIDEDIYEYTAAQVAQRSMNMAQPTVRTPVHEPAKQVVTTHTQKPVSKVSHEPEVDVTPAAGLNLDFDIDLENIDLDSTYLERADTDTYEEYEPEPKQKRPLHKKGRFEK